MYLTNSKKAAKKNCLLVNEVKMYGWCKKDQRKTSSRKKRISCFLIKERRHEWGTCVRERGCGNVQALAAVTCRGSPAQISSTPSQGVLTDCKGGATTLILRGAVGQPCACKNLHASSHRHGTTPRHRRDLWKPLVRSYYIWVIS